MAKINKNQDGWIVSEKKEDKPKTSLAKKEKVVPAKKEKVVPAKEIQAVPSKTENKAANNRKRKASHKLEKGVDGVIEYEDLGDMDSWDWNEVAAPDTVVGDDAGGFLCLEEISDVEVEYEGNDDVGKVVKFKRAKKDTRKSGKKAQPNAPLSIEETGKFIDIDDFDEKLVAQMEKKSDDKTVKMDVEMETVDEPMEEVTPSKHDKVKEEVKGEVKEKKTKAEKLLEKKKKHLEKLMSEVESLETKVSKDDSEADKKEKVKETPVKKNRPTLSDVDKSFDVAAWKDLKLAGPVIDALRYNKFSAPTPIQKETLPVALKGRDIIGSAETGSGKTLAFGIPIINYIATHEVQGLTALILTPTRELAIQVKDHIANMSVFVNLRVTAIVGGMSVQKQERLLRSKSDIVVATPGRLWELFSNNEDYMNQLKHVKFLVLDEADRMLEKGHFQELNNLLGALSKKRQDTTEWPEQIDEDKTKVVSRHVGNHQTFIFTATLSKDIRFNLKSKKKPNPKTATGTMEDLLKRIEFADKNPVLIDKTSDNIVAARLLEAKIECVDTDKDLYVYYFVTRYPGRTIIFVNSIDAIRRLVPVFKLLNVEVLGLHAQMQQRQRLKNLDRFKANDKAVLVASDVAARGLDIPLVDHVIHYQLPRSGEIYVHRSGRTARGVNDGISLLLCGPQEMKLYQKLCQTLRKNKQYPDFPVDMAILKAMQERVKLAVEIDKLLHQEDKQNHEVNWMKNMAKQLDVDFDEESMQGKGYQKSSEELAKARVKATNLKNKLAHMLKQPIMPAGSSSKFLTSGIVGNLVDRLMHSGAHDLLPGHSHSRAIDDLASSKKRKNK
ncbi:P-loop containing nucleoside triphosphate hydrolase protein [Pilobolus umbonatus]|nr:P-loop containing nucleoside triphosphate hydrolase protein [Pilobolus umbonatus]